MQKRKKNIITMIVMISCNLALGSTSQGCLDSPTHCELVEMSYTLGNRTKGVVKVVPEVTKVYEVIEEIRKTGTGSCLEIWQGGKKLKPTDVVTKAGSLEILIMECSNDPTCLTKWYKQKGFTGGPMCNECLGDVRFQGKLPQCLYRKDVGPCLMFQSKGKDGSPIIACSLCGTFQSKIVSVSGHISHPSDPYSSDLPSRGTMLQYRETPAAPSDQPPTLFADPYRDLHG